jgi:hypothetical protein
MMGSYRQFARTGAGMRILLPMFLILSACGGGGTQTSNTPSPPQTSSTNLLINIGDSPSDRVIAFATTMNSMTLANSGGGTVSVVSAAVPLEMMRLMGTMQPLAIISIPQGTYTKATMSMAATTVTYMDPVSKQAVQKTVPGMTATINFNPSVTISGTTPVIMNFDMDMAASIAIDASGNVSVNPTFKMAMGSFSSGSGQSPENESTQHLFGYVAGVSGNSFTMSMMQGSQSLAFMTNSGTRFDNMSGMGMMSNGMLTMVDAVLQADGTMLAQEVRSLMAGSGMMGGGIVTGVTGNPATQLTIVLQNGAGNGMVASYLASGITINVSGSTPYVIDSDGIDMAGLPFTPSFQPATVFQGQRIHAITGQTAMGSMMTGMITASEIDLEPQGLSGTVSGSTQTGSRTVFTLNLAPDCAFATLTGSTSVTVFQQTGTTMVGMNSVTNGSVVHARGLLFLDAGTYKLVAARIVAP